MFRTASAAGRRVAATCRSHFGLAHQGFRLVHASRAACFKEEFPNNAFDAHDFSKEFTPEEMEAIKKKYVWENVRGPNDISPAVKRIMAEVKTLDMLEVTELCDEIAKLYNVSENEMDCLADAYQLVQRRRVMGENVFGAGAGGGGADGGAEDAAAEEVKVEKTAFSVKLESFEASAKIKLIKEVRGLTGLGLKQAKELVESAPAVMKADMKKDDAEALVKKLEELGGKCSLD